CQKCDTAPWMF
nr:immunoglobulin light chain junction region [Macaca mulatta]